MGSGKISNVLWNAMRHQVGAALRTQPAVRDAAAKVETWMLRQQHSVGRIAPSVIRPSPHLIMLALTSYCNLRCQGCKYGRDFMAGAQLSWEHIRDVLDDAREAGIYNVRLYGGEPLLHPDLPRIVAYCKEIGLSPMVTTNAVVLSSRIDELYAAGLRDLSIGFLRGWRRIRRVHPEAGACQANGGKYCRCQAKVWRYSQDAAQLVTAAPNL